MSSQPGYQRSQRPHVTYIAVFNGRTYHYGVNQSGKVHVLAVDHRRTDDHTVPDKLNKILAHLATSGRARIWSRTDPGSMKNRGMSGSDLSGRGGSMRRPPPLHVMRAPPPPASVSALTNVAANTAVPSAVSASVAASLRPQHRRRPPPGRRLAQQQQSDTSSQSYNPSSTDEMEMDPESMTDTMQGIVGKVRGFVSDNDTYDGLLTVVAGGAALLGVAHLLGKGK